MASTFKVGLPINSKLRTWLALKLVMDLHKLMEWVEEYKRFKDDQLQDKAKAKAPMVEKKEIRIDHSSYLRRDFFPQVQKLRFKMLGSLYKELVYQIVEKIKNRPYF